MKHAALGALGALVALGVAAAPVAATAAPSPASTTAPTAQLSGTLVQVADALRGAPGATTSEEDSSAPLLQVGGTLVPLAATPQLAALASGTPLTVTVPVPSSVVAAATAARTVAAVSPGGRLASVRLSRGDLPATGRPAAPTSALSRATAAAAATSPLPAADVRLAKPVTLAATTATTAPPTAVSRTVAATTTPAPPASATPQSLTVVVADTNGYTSTAYTDAAITAMVSSVSAYWSEQTNGAVTFAQTGATTRYASAVSCSNYAALWSEAAQRSGFTAGANKHLVVLVPKAAYTAVGCSYGLGSVGTTISSGGVLYVADASWPALAHELGHNMSLQHADSLACSTPVRDVAQTSTGTFTFPAGCSEAPYGDGADVMSSSTLNATGNLGVVGLRQLGLLTTGQPSVTTTGVTTATLAPLSAHAGIRSLTVTDPRNGNVYYLENRQNSGRDTFGWHGTPAKSASFPQGTTFGLRVLKRSDAGTSVLLDPTPSPAGAWDADAVVAPGTTFTDVADGMELRSSAPDAGGAITVQVSLAPTGVAHWAGVSAPQAPVTAPQAPAVTATTTTLSVPATALTGQPVTVTGRVSSASGTPTGTVLLTAGGASGTLTLVNGTFSARFTPGGAGTVTLTAFYNAAAGFAGSSASASTVVTSPVTPTTTTVTAPATVAYGSRFTVSGRVSAAAGVVPTAVVIVKAGAVSYPTVAVGGAYSVAVTAAGAGAQDVTATLGAPSGYAVSSATTRVTVVR